MKSGFGKLVLLIIGLSVFFTYIGLYFLPQSKSLPPEVIEIKEGISQEELLDIGEEILFGKGQCMVCHPFKPEAGMRSPAIAGIGGEIAERTKGMDISPEGFIFQALVDTKAYIPEGYAPIMPPSQKLLTEAELIAVAAFIQSKGASVTISYPDSLPELRKYLGSPKKVADALIASEVKITESTSPEELLQLGKELYYDKGGCIECHPAEKDEDLDFPILPELFGDVQNHAKEQGKEPIAFFFESMVRPDAYIAEGMDDMMPASQDFLSESEMIAVGAYIQSQGGNVTLRYPDSLPALKKEIEKAGGG
jgi:mono/diheme cytochrome c family protein